MSAPEMKNILVVTLGDTENEQTQTLMSVPANKDPWQETQNVVETVNENVKDSKNYNLHLKKSSDCNLEVLHGYDYLVVLKTMSENEKSDFMLDRNIDNNNIIYGESNIDQELEIEIALSPKKNLTESPNYVGSNSSIILDEQAEETEYSGVNDCKDIEFGAMRIKESNIERDEICKDEIKVSDCLIKIEDVRQLKEEEFIDDTEPIDKSENKYDFFDINSEFNNENIVEQTEKYKNNEEMNVEENRNSIFLFEDFINDGSLPASPIESNSSPLARETEKSKSPKIDTIELESSVNESIDIDESSSPEIPTDDPENSSTPSRGTRSKIKSEAESRLQILTIYPPPPSPGGLCISVIDYKCLAEAEFLNDVIIDFYLKYLVRQKVSPENQDRVHVFSSHFFTRLTRAFGSNDSTSDLSKKDKRHEGVQRWTKNVDIFEKHFIIIPINQNAHWYLIIVCFPHLVGLDLYGDECNKRNAEWPSPCILVLDSLNNRNKNHVIKIIRDYLSSEYFAKHQEEKDFSTAVLKANYLKLPKQTNTYDCGIYLLQYVENFIEDFINTNITQLCDLEDWFEPSVIVKKREEIANIISCLAIDFHEGEPVVIPTLKFPEEKKKSKNNFFSDFVPPKPKLTSKSKLLASKPKSLPSILRNKSMAKNSNDPDKWISKPKESLSSSRTSYRSPVREYTRRKFSADTSFGTTSPPPMPLRKSQRNEWKTKFRDFELSFSPANNAQTRTERIMGLASSQLEQTNFMSKDGKKCFEFSKLPDKKRSYTSSSNKSENQNANTFNHFRSTDPFYKNPLGSDPYSYDSYEADKKNPIMSYPKFKKKCNAKESS